MPFQNLSSFLSHLEHHGELRRIRVEVDPILEITEIANRIGVAQHGPALLFENVKGSRFPVVLNALGTARRMEWALGRSPADIGNEIFSFAEDLMPPSPAAFWKHRALAGRVLKMKPQFVGSAAVTRNAIEPANLDLLPVAQSWPQDGGRFFTFPLVITQSPVDGTSNMGVYRMHQYDATQTGMHWQIGKGGGYHYLQAEARNESLPVAVAVGADPILMFCGVLPLPENISELAFAGFLRGERTRVTKLKGNGLTVPAESEFVLEGVVPPRERRMEGPYGDHFGHYSLSAPFPVFHVKRVWHRDKPVFPISVVGKPPQEDQVLGDAIQEMMLPLLKLMHPEIVDMWAYQEAGFHNLLVIAVKQRFDKEAVKTALWALGEGQLALSKCVILVDAGVNPRRFTEVLGAIRSNFDPARDFLLLSTTSQDTLDFTSFKMNLGSKMILDATGSIIAEAPLPDRPRPAPADVDALRRIDGRIAKARIVDNTMLVVAVKSNGREVLEKMLNSPLSPQLPLMIAVSEDVPLENPTLLLWGIFTRFDCARDTFFERAEIRHGHPVYGGRMFIDATWKPGYPDPLSMTDAVVKLVDRRWKDYGL
jgi:4-hydroxy-3-polyprenylbenzoate decarboxylase